MGSAARTLRGTLILRQNRPRRYPRTIAAEAQGLLTNKVPLPADTLQQLPHIKYIGVLATGYNIIDTQEASRLGITVA